LSNCITEIDKMSESGKARYSKSLDLELEFS
jgi:hypothetical protein